MLAWLKKHRRKVTGALVVIVPLVMLVSSAGAEIGRETTGAGQFGGGLLAGGQSLVAGAVGTVGDAWTRLMGGDLAEENERLRREVHQLREENTRLIGVLQENARLREMVGFQQQRPEFDLAAARVVGRDVTPYFRVEKIRIESDTDLEPRMPVVAPDGVVGQIHRLYDGYADVVLVADPRSRIDAVSQRNRAPGIVEGLGHEADYRARMAYVEERDEVRPGDTLVTSGMGSIFPRELRIGTVADVDRDDERLLQDIVVEPAVDFSRLEEVFVITNHR